MKYQSPRGTQDILPKDTKKWENIFSTCSKYFNFYNYKQIVLPIFEHTELFHRSVGESTDIVNKEMYTFNDRSDRSLTLRPEGTASLVRAFIQNGLHREPKPVKLWTHGPMFRYERSQTGRYRQFHQIDGEILGSSSISTEVESIYMLSSIFQDLGIDFRIDINTLGDDESKQNYKDYFKKFAKGFLGDICDDCKRRYEQNPLRMLDCKVKEDQEIYASSKKPLEFLSKHSEEKWESIKNNLGVYKEKDTRKIKNIFTNPNLVRGLDYYNDFVFEIVATSDVLKGQSAICGGGRYDKLVESLGGPPTDGYGFAMGVERVMLVAAEAADNISSIMFISNQEETFTIVDDLSKSKDINIKTEINLNPKNIGKQFEAAAKKNMDYAIVYLDNEKEKGIIKLKNLKTREEIECKKSPEAIIEAINKQKSNKQ